MNANSAIENIEEIGHQVPEIIPKFRAVSYISPVGTIEIFSTSPCAEDAFFKLPLSTDDKISVYPTHRSPCQERPYSITNSHFYAKILSFEDLKAKINSYLVCVEDYDFSYLDSSQMWKCKYVEGSKSREVLISCFFDAVQNDHIIEVRRIRGDGACTNATDLLAGLRSLFGIIPQSNPDMKRKNMGLLRFPPSLCVKPTFEQFSLSLQQIFSMISEGYYEPRLEGIKMLCDLANRKNEFLYSDVIVSDVTQRLSRLLLDSFSDIAECCCFCIFYLSSHPSYLNAFAHDAEIPSLLLRLVDNCVDADNSYLCAKVRRVATEVLCLLSIEFPNYVLWHLKRSGYASEVVWYRHANSLRDLRTRNMAISLCSCYQSILDPSLMSMDESITISVDL